MFSFQGHPLSGEAENLCKVTETFSNHQTFLAKIFVFSFRAGRFRQALVRGPLGSFSKASAKLAVFFFTTKYSAKKFYQNMR